MQNAIDPYRKSRRQGSRPRMPAESPVISASAKTSGSTMACSLANKASAKQTMLRTAQPAPRRRNA